MRVLVVGVVLLACLVQPGGAKTLYVKQGGVDTGLCETAGSPCGTFNFVFPKAVAGDTINLDTTGGVFTQTLRFNLGFTAQNGSAGNVITFQGKDGITAEIRPNAGNVEAVTFRNVRYWTMKNVRVDGRNLAGGASTTNGISISSSTYGSATDSRNITLEDVEIVDIRNPTGSNSLGISPVGDDITLTRLTVNGTHIAAGDFAGSHCVYQTAGNRIIIQNGIFENCGGFGIQLNDSGNVGAGDSVAHNTGGIIRYNRVIKNGRRFTGGGGITVYHHHINVTIQDNLVYDGDSGPAMLIEGSGSTGHNIWHNSIVGNAGRCIQVGTDASHPSSSMSFRDNICEANTSGANFDDFSSNSTITHNVFSDASGMLNTGSNNTVASNLTSDPLLVNVGGFDFHLQSGSPARNAGVDVGVTVDFDGVSYGTPPSIGAFEFGGAPPVVTIGLRRMVVY